MKFIRRLMTSLLATVITAVTIFAAMPFSAAADSAGITLGAGSIQAGSRVQLNGVIWRVLKSDGTQQVLLISENVLDTTQFNANYSDGNAWAGSMAQQWCTNYYDRWPDGPEKNAILPTTVNEENNKEDGGMSYYYQGGYKNDYYYGAAPLNGEYMFFLSAKEADTYFADDNDRKAGDVDSWWWLRSPYAHIAGEAGIVDDDGWVFSTNVGYLFGARPAFNLNLSSVLFSSLISSNPNVYKLTLKDNNLSISSNGSPTLSGNIITIPYTISGTGAQAYVMVTDSTNAVKQYTKLTEGSETGTGKCTLDSNITGTWGEDYKVYILAVNEDEEFYSDVASDLCEVSAPPEKPTEKPTEEPTATEIPTEPPTNPEEPTELDSPHYSIAWVTRQGWVKDYNGWHYYDKNGTKLKNQWLSDNGNWYYLDSKGNMATGWLLDNGKYYFLDETSGLMKTGWLYKDGSWYFLDYWTGARHTGWLRDNYNWYYMDDPSGIMQTGWVYDSGIWYYMYPSGAMATGWAYVDDAWYYFWSDGSMATGDVLIGDIWYSFDAGGAWVE